MENPHDLFWKTTVSLTVQDFDGRSFQMLLACSRSPTNNEIQVKLFFGPLCQKNVFLFGELL